MKKIILCILLFMALCSNAVAEDRLEKIKEWILIGDRIKSALESNYRYDSADSKMIVYYLRALVELELLNTIDRINKEATQNEK